MIKEEDRKRKGKRYEKERKRIRKKDRIRRGIGLKKDKKRIRKGLGKGRKRKMMGNG